MKFKAIVTVMPQREILDPQGKAVESALSQMGIGLVSDVRIGKQIELNILATSSEDAKIKIEAAASKLLANTIMEEFKVSIMEINQ